jgi:hypothetical protein
MGDLKLIKFSSKLSGLKHPSVTFQFAINSHPYLQKATKVKMCSWDNATSHRLWDIFSYVLSFGPPNDQAR